MLLCLTREQRITFIFGAIFEVPSDIAEEVLGLARGLPQTPRARPRRPDELHEREVRPREPEQSLPLPQEDGGAHPRRMGRPRATPIRRPPPSASRPGSPRPVQALQALVASTPDHLFPAIRAEMGRTSPRSWCVSSGQGSGCGLRRLRRRCAKRPRSLCEPRAANAASCGS